ncbi:hypothetical protein D3C85_1303490 [compost metagenome]
MQFVADGSNAFNAFRYGDGLLSLRLAFNKAAQSDHFFIRFHGNVGALDVFIVHQSRFHFCCDRAVIHEITDFIHRAIDFLPCAIRGGLHAVFSKCGTTDQKATKRDG